MDYEKTTFSIISLVTSLGYNLFFDASKAKNEKGLIDGPYFSIRIGLGASNHKEVNYLREMNEDELYSMKNYWKKVQQRNDVDDYKKFISKYPNSIFIPSAQKGIYKILKNNNDNKGMSYFLLELENYIDSNRVEQNINQTKQIVSEMFTDKMKATDSLIANVWYYSLVQNGYLWKEVTKWLKERTDKNKYENYDSYINNLLNRKHTTSTSDAVEEELAWEKSKQKEKTAWERAKQTNTSKSYEEFTTNHPSSEYKDSVKNAIEKLAWEETEKANTNEAYFDVSAKYPMSKYFNKVGIKIISLGFQNSIKIYTGRMVLMTNGFQNQTTTAFAEKGDIILITEIIITGIKGGVILGKNDISITDSKGKIYHPLYMERYINHDMAYIIEPQQIWSTADLIFATSLPVVSKLNLTILNEDVGPIKVGTIGLIKMAPSSLNELSNNSFPAAGFLRNYLPDK